MISVLRINIKSMYILTHCALMTKYGKKRPGSILVQTMACCLTAPLHCLNQCWFSLVKFCGIHLRAMSPWWPNQMETFSALLTICAGYSPVTGEFPVQRPVTRSFDVFFDLRLNKRLSKQSWGWWFEMPSRSLWCHCNDTKRTCKLPAIVYHEHQNYI